MEGARSPTCPPVNQNETISGRGPKLAGRFDCDPDEWCGGGMNFRKVSKVREERVRFRGEDSILFPFWIEERARGWIFTTGLGFFGGWKARDRYEGLKICSGLFLVFSNVWEKGNEGVEGMEGK